MTSVLQRRLAAAIVALAVLTAACTASGAPAAPGQGVADTVREQPRGEPAPATSFRRFDGSTTSFAAYRGRPLVVNFWASWCPSCVAEMSAAFRPVQEKVGDRVAFLGIDMQDERADAERLVAETGVLFDLAEDPDGALYLELGGLGMPYTVFIDAAGNVVAEHNGPLTESQLLAEIARVFPG